MSEREIAKALGVSRMTVRHDAERAFQKIAAALGIDRPIPKWAKNNPPPRRSNR